MRLVTFEADGNTAIGRLEGDGVVDLTSVLGPDTTMVDLISGFAGLASEIGAVAGPVHPLGSVRLAAPLRPVKNVFAIGRNYVEHVNEVPGPDAAPRPLPENPIVFSKPPTSVIGPGAAIETANDPTGTTDYEGELAVVIGSAAKGVSAAAAWEHVFGYTVLNDVTARALQRRHEQWLVGKGPDTFCPIGPCLVTADEVPDVGALTVRTTVNGELRQEGSVSDLIFDIPTLIATLSATMTLEPGDIIATGTPSGVGAGFDPPRFLQPGDLVEVEVEGIGTLSNPVV